MSVQSLTRNDVISNPKLLNKWCEVVSEVENVDPHEMSERAKKEFGKVWSEAKINYLIDSKFKNPTRQANALKRTKKLTKKQWIKKNAKALAVGIKNGYITMADDFGEDIANAKEFVNN